MYFYSFMYVAKKLFVFRVLFFCLFVCHFGCFFVCFLFLFFFVCFFASFLLLLHLSFALLFVQVRFVESKGLQNLEVAILRCNVRSSYSLQEK